MNKIDLKGRIFFRWTVIEEAPKSGRSIKWVCKCSCGQIRIVATTTLNKGKSKSCGCYAADNCKKMFTKHGDTIGGHSKEFLAWISMKDRCLNEENKRFSDWGGRGIKVCERWVNSYENFLLDMGRKPSINHTLDRIDNEGDYTPSNCRWATKKEQSINRRSTVWIEYNGIKMMLSDWAVRLHVHQRTLRRYLNKHGFENAHKRFSNRIKSNLINYSFGHII